MKAQDILQGICRHRANPLQHKTNPQEDILAGELQRKLDEIEWALQAIAEYLVDNEK